MNSVNLLLVALASFSYLWDRSNQILLSKQFLFWQISFFFFSFFFSSGKKLSRPSQPSCIISQMWWQLNEVIANFRLHSCIFQGFLRYRGTISHHADSTNQEMILQESMQLCKDWEGVTMLDKAVNKNIALLEFNVTIR